MGGGLFCGRGPFSHPNHMLGTAAYWMPLSRRCVLCTCCFVLLWTRRLNVCVRPLISGIRSETHEENGDRCASGKR